MVLPLPVVAVLVLVQAGALLIGFFGPPGGRPRPLLAAVLVGSGVVLMALGMGAVTLARPEAGTLMVWAGALLLAPSARLLRAPGEDRHDDEDDGGGGGGPDGPPRAPSGPAPDWAAFDREREAWARGTPAGAS